MSSQPIKGVQETRRLAEPREDVERLRVSFTTARVRGRSQVFFERHPISANLQTAVKLQTMICNVDPVIKRHYTNDLETVCRPRSEVPQRTRGATFLVFVQSTPTSLKHARTVNNTVSGSFPSGDTSRSPCRP